MSHQQSYRHIGAWPHVPMCPCTRIRWWLHQIDISFFLSSPSPSLPSPSPPYKRNILLQFVFPRRFLVQKKTSRRWGEWVGNKTLATLRPLLLLSSSPIQYFQNQKSKINYLWFSFRFFDLFFLSFCVYSHKNMPVPSSYLHITYRRAIWWGHRSWKLSIACL